VKEFYRAAATCGLPTHCCVENAESKGDLKSIAHDESFRAGLQATNHSLEAKELSHRDSLIVAFHKKKTSCGTGSSHNRGSILSIFLFFAKTKKCEREVKTRTF